MIQPNYEFGDEFYEDVEADKARDMFKTIIESLEEEAARIRQCAEADVSDEFNTQMQEKIREFAVTFRNGNIVDYFDGPLSSADVQPGQFGWTISDMSITDMEAFKERIDQFESSSLPDGDCKTLRLLIVKLRDAAAGERQAVHPE